MSSHLRHRSYLHIWVPKAVFYILGILFGCNLENRGEKEEQTTQSDILIHLKIWNRSADLWKNKIVMLLEFVSLRTWKKGKRGMGDNKQSLKIPSKQQKPRVEKREETGENRKKPKKELIMVF